MTAAVNCHRIVSGNKERWMWCTGMPNAQTLQDCNTFGWGIEYSYAGPPGPMAWAEALIRQLPDTHEGRNSWLRSFGRRE